MHAACTPQARWKHQVSTSHAHLRTQATLELCKGRVRLDARHHAAGMAACHACDEWRRAHVLLAAAAQRRGTLKADSYAQGMLLFEVQYE